MYLHGGQGLAALVFEGVVEHGGSGFDDLGPGLGVVGPVAADGAVAPTPSAVEDVDVAADPAALAWSGVVPGGQCAECFQGGGEVAQTVGGDGLVVLVPQGVPARAGVDGVSGDAAGVGGVGPQDVGQAGLDAGQEADGAASGGVGQADGGGECPSEMSGPDGASSSDGPGLVGQAEQGGQALDLRGVNVHDHQALLDEGVGLDEGVSEGLVSRPPTVGARFFTAAEGASRQPCGLP